MIDISGFGTGLYVIGGLSFPLGFHITAFADDSDAIEVQQMEVVGYEPLYDGTTFKYKKTAPVKVSISVIPGSDDDTNLAVLLNGNRATLYTHTEPENIIIVVKWPGDFLNTVTNSVILSGGTILSGPPFNSLSSNGRYKGNKYNFVFDNLVVPLRSLETAALSVAGGLLSASPVGGFIKDILPMAAAGE